MLKSCIKALKILASDDGLTKTDFNRLKKVNILLPSMPKGTDVHYEFKNGKIWCYFDFPNDDYFYSEYCKAGSLLPWIVNKMSEVASNACDKDVLVQCIKGGEATMILLFTPSKR